jgi:hypothetical protein
MASSYGINLNAASTRTRPTKAQLIAQGMSDLEAQQLLDEMGARQYGGGMSNAELQDFETLIGRLEGSKMRQAAQANRARQRDVMAGGLASMMTNF